MVGRVERRCQVHVAPLCESGSASLARVAPKAQRSWTARREHDERRDERRREEVGHLGCVDGERDEDDEGGEVAGSGAGAGHGTSHRALQHMLHYLGSRGEENGGTCE